MARRVHFLNRAVVAVMKIKADRWAISQSREYSAFRRLWQSLCYAQIGGLAVATFITLLLVPVFYAIFVLDLKWITWEVAHPSGDKVERKADSPLLGSVSS